MSAKFWAAAFMLTGTIIGAGILGLPYAASRAGFPAVAFWIIVLGLILMAVNLYAGEISLRTKSTHQLPGYAEKYLGPLGKGAMLFAVVFGIYAALIAYLIGEGQSLSQLFVGNTGYAVPFALGFWILMTLLLGKGLQELKKVETWGVLAVLFVVLLIVVMFLPQTNISSLSAINWGSIFLPFGIVMFALLGITSVPELKRELNGGKQLKWAIILGSAIPIIVYLVFTAIVFGTLGQSTPQVATLALGSLPMLLGIFTMGTGFFVLSFVLKDAFVFDLNFSRQRAFFLTSILPLAIYLLIAIFGVMSFALVLGIGGVVAGSIEGIVVLLAARRAKKHGDRKPEYSIPLGWTLIVALSLLFVAGMFLEFVF